MTKGKLKRRRLKGNTVASADTLDGTVPAVDALSGCHVSVFCQGILSLGKDTPNRRVSRDDPHPPFLAFRESFFEWSLVQQGIWHGDKEEIQIEMLQKK